MPCANCQAEQTIKAHLIPRVFANEIKEGKRFAANVTSGDSYKSTQSGIWDPEILCGDCDGILGAYENYAFKVTQQIRDTECEQALTQHELEDIDTDKLLRFCAGILYKFSLTKRENGRIQLGRYQELLRRYIFDAEAECPKELDALLIRPLRYPNDHGVFAYRSPRNDRMEGVNFYRMMMGGVIFFVVLDRQGTSTLSTRDDFLKAHGSAAKFTTVPAQAFEEYTIPAGLAHEGRLSGFLDRVEAQGAGSA